MLPHLSVTLKSSVLHPQRLDIKITSRAIHLPEKEVQGTEKEKKLAMSLKEWVG
jgi:hypothetical protein